MTRAQTYQPIKKEFIPLEKNQEVEISVLGLREVIENAEESDIPTSVEKSESGIVPVPIIVNRTETHNSGDAAKQGSVRANILGIIPFAKKIFSKKEKQKMAVAPKPLPEGELVISFYDSTKELLSTEILSLKSENEWETLSFSTKAEEKGFVSASIRGTSTEPVKFDDFSIQLKSLYSAKLYQENHYYPFGMNMKGLESSDKQTQQNKKEHEFQFNAQTEREESFGLFWDETPFRNYDSQLGRLWGVDLLSEIYPTLSPFQYAFNNPIGFNDPTGLFGQAYAGSTNVVDDEDPPIPSPIAEVIAEYYAITPDNDDNSSEEEDDDYWNIQEGKTPRVVKTITNFFPPTAMLSSGNAFATGSDMHGKKREGLDLWLGALDFIPEMGTIGKYTVLGSKQAILWGIVKLNFNLFKRSKKILFGQDPNQVYHAFRHIEKLGLDRDKVRKAILKDFKKISNDIQPKQSVGRVIDVDGIKVKYFAFEFEKGKVNIGRIHGAGKKPK